MPKSEKILTKKLSEQAFFDKLVGKKRASLGESLVLFLHLSPLTTLLPHESGQKSHPRSLRCDQQKDR